MYQILITLKTYPQTLKDPQRHSRGGPDLVSPPMSVAVQRHSTGEGPLQGPGVAAQPMAGLGGATCCTEQVRARELEGDVGG